MLFCIFRSVKITSVNVPQFHFLQPEGYGEDDDECVATPGCVGRYFGIAHQTNKQTAHSHPLRPTYAEDLLIEHDLFRVGADCANLNVCIQLAAMSQSVINI